MGKKKQGKKKRHKRHKCPRCNTYKAPRGFYFRSGARTKSCRKCLLGEQRRHHRRRIQEHPIEARVTRLLQGSRFRAKSKGLPHDLDEQWLRPRLERRICEVTGIPFSEKVQRPAHRYCPSIDRIDPTKGYTKENSRVVCMMLNIIKRDYSDAEIISVGVALKAWGESQGMSSRLEEQLDEQIKKAGIHKGMVRELRAIEGRRFRVDFCWPQDNLAVEVQGGIWTRGRHARPMGIVKDYEKFNLLTLGGWRVLLLTSLDVQSGKGLKMILDALHQPSSSS